MLTELEANLPRSAPPRSATAMPDYGSLIGNLYQYLEDIPVGHKTTTPGRTITEHDIMTFAGLTGDYNPLHTDAIFATGTRFGQRVAHGQLVLAVGAGLVNRPNLVPATPASFIALYSIEKVRFPRAVLIGDTIRLDTEATALEFTDDKIGLLTTVARVINQNGEVCCVFTCKSLCGRRPR